MNDDNIATIHMNTFRIEENFIAIYLLNCLEIVILQVEFGIVLHKFKI